jgi:hypothetical protein
MSANLEEARRVARLLRWYPAAWRERYGEEFADHLEQEFTDRPHDLGRTVNVVYKGLVARVADVGLSSDQANEMGHVRAATGTTFALSALMAFVALAFWSRSMALWNGFHKASVPNTIATGVMTVATGLLLLVLLVTILVVAFLVVRQFVRGRARRLFVPSSVAVVTGAFLLYAARLFPRLLTAYLHGAHGFKGIRLSHPGQFIKALAEITWIETQRWIALWAQGATSTPRMATVVNDLVPVALLIFGVAMALLLRRVELPQVVERLGFVIVALFGTLSAAFFVSYLVWIGVGGQDQVQSFAPEGTGAGVAYLGFVAFATFLVGRAGLLSWRFQHRAKRRIA